MTNAWIDEHLYLEPWVRSVGPIALHVYLAATNFIHREAREEHTVTRRELRDAFPWEISDADLEAAIQRLVARDRFVVDGDTIELPLYEFEQEDNAKRRDRRAQNKLNAAKGMKGRERDARGQLVPKRPANVQRIAGSTQRNAVGALVDPASGPIHPVHSILPPSAVATATAPAGPVADATGGVETNRKPGKGKPRQPNLNGTADHPRKRSEAQEAWDHYAARFVKRSGSPPLPEAHFFVSLDRRLKSGVTKAEIIKRVDRYFDAPPFSLREGARDFGRFLKCFDMLADVGQPEGPDLTWRGIYREDDSGTNGEVRT